MIRTGNKLRWPVLWFGQTSKRTVMTNTQEEKEEKLLVPELTGVGLYGRHLEQMYVYDAYDQIAPYFVNIQHKAWPHVRQFLKEMEPGSLVADIGCGNGRYLGINSTVHMVGCDRCKGMVDIANQRGFEAAIADNLRIPYRDGMFDGAISVAVIHHFVTVERRVQAIKELARIVQPGGRLMIYVWAYEQKYRKFESSDVLVPWFHQLRNKNPSLEKKGRRGNSGHENEGGRRRSSRSSGKSSRRRSGKKTGDSNTSSSRSSGTSKTCSLEKCAEKSEKHDESEKGTDKTEKDIQHDDSVNGNAKPQENCSNVNYAFTESMHHPLVNGHTDSSSQTAALLSHSHVISVTSDKNPMENGVSSSTCVNVPYPTDALDISGKSAENTPPIRACPLPQSSGSTTPQSVVIPAITTEPPPPQHIESHGTTDDTETVQLRPTEAVAIIRRNKTRRDVISVDGTLLNDDPVWVLRDEAASSRTSCTNPTVISVGQYKPRRPSSLNLDDFTVSVRTSRKADRRNRCLQRCADCLCSSTHSPSESIMSIADYIPAPRELIMMETSLGSQQLNQLLAVKQNNEADPAQDDEMLSKTAFTAGIKDTLLTWFGKKSRTDSGSSVNENIGSSNDLNRSLSWKEYYHKFLRDNSSLYANVENTGAAVAPLVEPSASTSDACYDNGHFAVREFPLSSCPRDWISNMPSDAQGAVSLMSNNLTDSQDFSGELDDTTSPLTRKFSSIKSVCNRVQNSFRSASKMSLNSDRSASYKGPYYHILESDRQPRTSSESDSYQYNNTGASLFDGFVYNCSTSNSTSYDDSGNFLHKLNTESDSSGSAQTYPKMLGANHLNNLTKPLGYTEAKPVDFNALKSVNLVNDGNHLLNVKRNKNGYHKLAPIQDEQIQEVSKIAKVNPSFKFSDGKNPCAYEVKKVNSRSSVNIDAIQETLDNQNVEDGNIRDAARREIPTVELNCVPVQIIEALKIDDYTIARDANETTVNPSFHTVLPLVEAGITQPELNVLEPDTEVNDTKVSQEQEDNKPSEKHKADVPNNSQDVPENVPDKSTSSKPIADSVEQKHCHKNADRTTKSVSCQRYYHVFKEGELKQLIEDHIPNLHIVKTFYDHANWCVVAEKVRVWNV